MPAFIMRIDRRWLAYQRTMRDKEPRAHATMRHSRAAGRKSPYTACCGCGTELSAGSLVVSRPSGKHRKRWCVECAVRYGVCKASEVSEWCRSQ